MAFCYSFNCTLLPITICNCSSRLTLTTDKTCTDIKKMWDWLFDCLYRLSKLVEIQMINCISKKKITPPAHKRPESPSIYWIHTGVTMTTHVSFEVTVPSTLI